MPLMTELQATTHWATSSTPMPSPWLMMIGGVFEAVLVWVEGGLDVTRDKLI
jgi:hypothetical protein